MIIGRKTDKYQHCLYQRRREAGLISGLKRRLKGIRTGPILESGYIEQFIEDAPGSVFATIGYTEKPDVAAAKILEGVWQFWLTGRPSFLTAPFVLLESFQAAGIITSGLISRQ